MRKKKWIRKRPYKRRAKGKVKKVRSHKQRYNYSAGLKGSSQLYKVIGDKRDEPIEVTRYIKARSEGEALTKLDDKTKNIDWFKAIPVKQKSFGTFKGSKKKTRKTDFPKPFLEWLKTDPETPPIRLKKGRKSFGSYSKRRLKDELEVPGEPILFKVTSKEDTIKEAEKIMDKWEAKGWNTPNEVPESSEKQKYRDLLKSLGLSVKF